VRGERRREMKGEILKKREKSAWGEYQEKVG